MEDGRDPHYTPFRKLSAKPTVRTPGELLWELRKDHVTWSAEVKFLGEDYGWQALILRAGDLFSAHRFALKAHAVAWADEQRVDIERGWVEL